MPAQENQVCLALVKAKPFESRFVGILPLEPGGFLATLGGAKRTEVGNALHSLGVLGAHITDCGSSGLVLFIPAVDRSGADELMRALQSQIPSLQNRENVLLPP